MKNLALLMVLLLGVTFGSLAQKTEKKVVCFKSDMDCADCELTLTENLKFEKGVKDLKIDFTSNTILIEYKEGKNSEESLAKVIEKAGYTADKISSEKYKEIVEQTKKADQQPESEEQMEKK